jgi:DNA-directed RNA polymerase specialized sigma24 family protein
MAETSATPATDWGLIARATGEPSLEQRLAMQALLAQYLPALKTHVLARWRVRIERAEDLLQAFLTAKVVEDNLIAQASEEKGKFRHFLRRTLDDFIIDQYRRENARKRSPGRIAPLAEADLLPDENAGAADEAFEVAWAREVIAAALGQMRQECTDGGRPDIWGVFECRVVKPLLENDPPTPYEQVVEQWRLKSPIQAANVLATGKRMFERNLRAVLRGYTGGEGGIDAELRELREILARCRA